MTPRILIVEDNLPFAINIESYLEEWGYIVTGIAEDGKTALRHIVNDQPDLILMDIHINGNVSGVDIALAVKDQNIPIIFITGERDKNFYESAKNTRAVSYLVKPFDMLTLKAAIELNAPPPPQKATTPPLYIRRGKELVQVHTDEIIRITSDRNYCDIFTPSGRLTSRTTLKNLHELLPADQFVRIHLKHIVRLDAITGVFLSEQKVRVGDTFLPIGRKFKQDFLDKIECL